MNIECYIMISLFYYEVNDDFTDSPIVQVKP
jgi:hypothetical protein